MELIQKPKIICPGFERTGTTSLSRALNTLGFKTLEVEGHWYFVQRNKTCLTFVPNVEQASLYDAYVDSPIPLIYRSLVDLFSNSKIILTYRPIDAWLRSIEALHEQLGKWVFDPRDVEWKYLLEAYNLQMHGSPWFDRNLYAESYEKYYSELRTFFRYRQEPILELDITRGESWDRICDFLRVPIPNEAFPHLNATRSA